MILSFEEIKKIAVGAPFIENTDEGIKFYKYRPSFAEVWAAHEVIFGERALCSTGVRLDFHTNSKHMTVEVDGKKKFEIYINGLLRYSMVESEILSVDIASPLGEPREEARVTIYFPSHSRGVLKRLELDDGAYVDPHKFDRKILFMGDSITQGWEAKFNSLSYANRVSRYFNADSVIQGIGGSRFFDDCLEPIPYDPDWVFVAYGTNDFRHADSADEFRRNLRAFMSKLRELYGDKKVFVISPIWRENQEPLIGLTFTETREAIVTEAKKNGFTHIDGLNLVPPIPAFYTDGLHPNDNGFSIYAENLIATIRAELGL